MVEDRDPGAQCAEIYASNDTHMRHDILLSKHKQRVPCGHRYPLLPVTQKTDWIRLHRTARRKSPARLAAGGMQGEEVPFVRATKNETACSREQARPRRRMERKFPCWVSRGDFGRAHRAPRFQSGNAAETAGAEKVAGMVFGHAKIKAGRLFARRDIEQAGLRTVRRTEPVGPAMQPRIHHGAFGRRRLALHQDGPSAVIEPLGPGLPGEGSAEQKLACGTVAHVVKTVAI